MINPIPGQTTLVLLLTHGHFHESLTALCRGEKRIHSCPIGVSARQTLGTECTVNYGAVYFGSTTNAHHGYAILPERGVDLVAAFDNAVTLHQCPGTLVQLIDVDQPRFDSLLAQLPVMLQMEMYLP